MDARAEKPAMTPQQAELAAGRRSALDLYREIAVGKRGMADLIYYEVVTTLLANLPGLAGLGLRSKLYRPMFAVCGKRPAFGRSMTVRNPAAIRIGDKLLADDFSVLDARGNGAAIEIGDYVSIGRFTTIAAKGGTIELSRGVNIGSYSRIATQSRVEIGESTLVAAFCYIGPGNHQAGDDDVPLIAREMEIKGGVRIGRNCWIGARATILDGVTIGDNAVVGAHSLVRENVPSGATVVGAPARLVKC